MLKNLFANIPDVTKNLLILNVLFFVISFVAQAQGLNFQRLLGMYYPSSPFFEPYQLITHFFMHGSLGHIFFNMFGLVVFGSHLERVWGKQRFFIFYFITAIGAALLHFFVQGLEIYNLTGQWFPNIDIEIREISQYGVSWYHSNGVGFEKVSEIYITTTLGASGAVYGLLMAFAMLFPNTRFMLLFPPIPIKAKWLALILGLMALYQGFESGPENSIAHFAHLGGMLFAFILIKIWNKDRNKFY